MEFYACQYFTGLVKSSCEEKMNAVWLHLWKGPRTLKLVKAEHRLVNAWIGHRECVQRITRESWKDSEMKKSEDCSQIVYASNVS